jgi:hypothetical protein
MAPTTNYDADRHERVLAWLRTADEHCRLCGSWMHPSEGIIPPRLVCSRSACDGQAWPPVDL